MASMRLKFLSAGEEDFVHAKSLEILEKVGVMVRSDSVLSILEDAGASIDRNMKIAKIPNALVEETISTAKKEFVLCARDPKNDVTVPSKGTPHMTTDGLTLYMIDLATGERRNATRKDYGEFARIADALDAVDFFWPIVTISDVPESCHSAYELWTAFQNCTMHVQGDCTSAQDARKQIELASLVAGGGDELRKRPLFSSAIDPISPLSFDAGPAEAQVEFARMGVPVLCHSMSMPGMSAPVTMAGTISNINAENLASLVISQCASPGAPHIYGSASAPIDMATGSIDFTAPEHLFISAATGQMARRYGRPCMVADWGFGKNGIGFTTSFSEGVSYSGSVLSGSDLVSGIGGLDCAKGCSMAQMVIDSFIWDNFKAFMKDFTIDAEAVSIDVTREVGHGNSYLTHGHTARTFRKELQFWDKRKLSLEASLSDRMIPEARRVARELLDGHEVPELDGDVAEKGERVLDEYRHSAI